MKTQPDKKLVRDEAVKLSQLQNKLWESGSYYDGTKLRKVVLDFFSEELAAKFGQNIVVTYDNKNSKFEFKMLPLGFDSQEAVKRELAALENTIKDLNGQLQTKEVQRHLEAVTMRYYWINTSAKKVEEASQNFGATLSKISEQFNAKYIGTVKPIMNQSKSIAIEIGREKSTLVDKGMGIGEKTAKISAFTGLASLVFVTALAIGAAESIFLPQLQFAQSLLFSKVGIAAGATVAGSLIGFVAGVNLENNKNPIYHTVKDVKPDSFLEEVLGGEGKASIFNIIETTVEGLAKDVNAAMGSTVFPNPQQLAKDTVNGVAESLYNPIYPQLHGATPSAPPMSPVEAIEAQMQQLEKTQSNLYDMLTQVGQAAEKIEVASAVVASLSEGQSRGQN